jgi:hypothetical protein
VTAGKPTPRYCTGGGAGGLPSQSPATSDADDCDGANELIDMRAAGTSNSKYAALSFGGSHCRGSKHMFAPSPPGVR